jgi:hypothetical protein
MSSPARSENPRWGDESPPSDLNPMTSVLFPLPNRYKPIGDCHVGQLGQPPVKPSQFVFKFEIQITEIVLNL